MNVRLIPVLFLFSILSNIAYGQDETKQTEKKVKITMDGLFVVAVGKDFYSINLGGPTVMVNINKDLSFGIGPVPSLFSKEGKFGPKLGMAPRMEYKHLVIMAPFFTGENFGDWIGSIGVGYKFQKRK